MNHNLIPFNHEHALIRQHSHNRLVENTLDYNIRNNMKKKTNVIPFESSSSSSTLSTASHIRFPINKQFHNKYSPNGYYHYERTNNNSQVLNLRSQNENENNKMKYMNGEYDSVNGRRYAIPQSTKHFYSRGNSPPTIVTDNKSFAAHNNIPIPNVGNNNYSSINNANINHFNSYEYSHNNNTNVNNVSHSRSYSTKNIYHNNNNNKLSRSQSLPDLPEYRCRDNISSHSNIMNLRRPPQYYKNSIMYHKYTPFRGDYGNSRYGDYTYNYYLNSPMRGDVSEDWRFPPQYYYMPKFNSHTYTYDNY